MVAGDEDAVLMVAARWAAKGRKTKRLRVSHAFHCFHMDPMLDRFQCIAESLRFAAPQHSDRLLPHRKTGHPGGAVLGRVLGAPRQRTGPVP